MFNQFWFKHHRFSIMTYGFNIQRGTTRVKKNSVCLTVMEYSPWTKYQLCLFARMISSLIMQCVRVTGLIKKHKSKPELQPDSSKLRCCQQVWCINSILFERWRSCFDVDSCCWVSSYPWHAICIWNGSIAKYALNMAPL